MEIQILYLQISQFKHFGNKKPDSLKVLLVKIISFYLLPSAGDHIKFNFPMAFSVTSLAWGLLEFKDAYEDAGQLEYMYDSIKWPLDYLMKCHVAPNVYYVQV